LPHFAHFRNLFIGKIFQNKKRFFEGKIELIIDPILILGKIWGIVSLVRVLWGKGKFEFNWGRI